MAKKKHFNQAIKFIIMISLLSIPLSAIFDTGTVLLDGIPWYIGIFIVLFIVVLGAFFDMIGVAAAAANETPFHAMASKKIAGATSAVLIIRNAERVASICSDVIGDIAGVLSGATALAVGTQIVHTFHIHSWLGEAVSIGLTVIATSLTIGCKALGKTIAVYFPTPIILYTARRVEPFIKLTLKKERKQKVKQ
ncbi:hypothetical protein GCM10011391_11780 [Pullulanibacillus camelliae]|uniref:DUF21 domain-containing protein n=1 Tax=Pullulanibacillus camelliae TaxID=1707096 RepID=A0A8J2VRR1_9BACL|nr:hypothetical protein [Pullulanibacillus camelliae]GGE34792.1 hypothetical protein GCM10011391_11780 [Pullulanibacillus camelliae]